MSTLNFARKEISFKIVYYGPAMSGKTTNLRYIYTALPQKIKGNFTSIATETERTLFFDFLPLELGTIKGFTIKLSLYTVPGQFIYKLTRKSVLKSCDGIIFVADSQKRRKEENIESFIDMMENLKEFGESLETVPIIIQYNKRDLNYILRIEELEESLNSEKQFESYETIATRGEGVIDTLKGITRLVVSRM
ncbi:MAG: gliding-motility protein MglA [Caldiserica bacterium CG_4_8_14_3_um_filter_35_18]|nr:GTPase domain-containing protein [Caldisericota bacterium]PIW10760.1 MAG: gliding-motility protein MglA [Caldiserica bacterium CG17_big_fil_post_rev_8_21_14_2_50_35_7]PIX29427.1 MAG: gliding-motility protein MglA [Caldiserica bacterium CG_4_8_14_3_um_filter_35_18]